MSEERRWNLYSDEMGDFIGGPPFSSGVEVMPVSEHEALRQAAQALVEEIQAKWVWTPEVGRRFEHLRDVLVSTEGSVE